MYTNNRDAYRLAFFTAWQKYQKNNLLTPLEVQLIDVILLHPEYHRLLEKNASTMQQNYTREENPFLHMSLHLTLREQIKTNRPAGIKQVYQHLFSQQQNPHEVEHLMIACLEKILWQAQQTGQPADERVYLENLNLIYKK